MEFWITIALLASMAAIVVYACCSVAGEADRRDEEYRKKSGKGRDDA